VHRLIRFLKPYAALVALTVVLLFVQANADLALPDYMSRIVNVGIQQGGVESAVPRAVRASTMDRLTLVLSAEEEALVRQHYTLIDRGSVTYGDYVKQYPALADGPIYVLQDVDRETVDRLGRTIGRALIVVSWIDRWLSDPSQAPTVGTDAGFGLDLSQLPPGADPLAQLAQLAPAQRAQVTDAIAEGFDALGDGMIEQMAVAAVKVEYEALGMDTGKLQTDYIVDTGVLMLLISLLGGSCTVAVGFLAARTAAGAARDIRRELFVKVEGFSSVEFDQFSTASLITRSTNDVTQVQMVIFMIIRMAFFAPIIGVGAVIRAIDKGAGMWWIIAVAVVALLSLIVVVFVIALPKFRIIQSLIDRLNLVTRENLSGMMVIRAFNKQGFEEKRFDGANRDLTETSLFVTRVMVTMMPVMMLLMNGLTLAIMWAGAHQVAQARMQVGDMIAFLQYAMQIVFAFLTLSMLFIFIPRAAVSGARIADVLETETTINDPAVPLRFREPVTGAIEFRQVSFRYPDALDDVLHAISFTARPGETTALIGSTGCGKSTLVNLIPRFYDVTGGSISIDGTDIRHVTQRDLRDKIGYVPQRGMLFSGTIESNLRYGDQDASDELLAEATAIAQADEFIDARPEGLAAEIAQGGANVSGGQKQRLAIARALVKRPPIYILDDSFSALDFRTESALRRALRAKTDNSTVLFVTQRVASVKNADQIVVLDEGRIAGKGTHDELMESCPTYREIAVSQLAPEEL
jgi:ATP-binding cassette, subfamily B, multidrug efflux pump